MYNQNYEEYMRSVLGYPYDIESNYENTYNRYESYGTNYQNAVNNTINTRLEEFYPEIYKKIYPMICKTCDIYNGKQITEEILKEMIASVYSTIEENSRNENKNSANSKTEKNESRIIGGNIMNDLIRILILRELFDRYPINRPPYPPMPPRPPRPPYPGPYIPREH